MTEPRKFWAIPVVCPGFRSDDPVRWFLVPVGSDEPVQGVGWPDKESAETHGESMGLSVLRELEP